MATTTATTTTTSTDPNEASSLKTGPASPPPKAGTQIHQTGRAVRLASRTDAHTTVTAAQAPGHLQANLIVLPSKHAEDFRRLCQRNPVPCPLLAESVLAGDFERLRSCVPGVLADDMFVGGAGEGGEGEEGVAVAGFDVRTDLPAYNVYRSGRLVESSVPDIKRHWDTSDHIAFLIGCSFSFESALSTAGLPPRHTLPSPRTKPDGGSARNVPMYRTTLPLLPSGVFEGATSVVSMRPYPLKDVAKVREVTAPFTATHGEPVAWGWAAVAALGISDIDTPDWGDAATSTKEGGGLLGERSWGSEEEVPVFWGCGVSPQEAVMRAGERIEGVVMGHLPGHMLVLDARDEELLGGRK